MGSPFHLQILQKDLRQWTNGARRSLSFRTTKLSWSLLLLYGGKCKGLQQEKSKIDYPLSNILLQTLPYDLFHNQLLFLFQSSKDSKKKEKMIWCVIEPMRVIMQVKMSSKIPSLIHHQPNQNYLINMS